MERAGARSEIEGFLVTQNIAEEATQCPLSLSPSLSPSLPLNALPLSLPPSLPLSLGRTKQKKQHRTEPPNSLKTTMLRSSGAKNHSATCVALSRSATTVTAPAATPKLPRYTRVRRGWVPLRSATPL